MTSATQHHVLLDEAQLLFLTELIAFMYCNSVKEASISVLRSKPPIAPVMMEGLLREHLRGLLREPLRNPLFRATLAKHFSRHQLHDVREIAWKWMEEVLVWES